MVNKISYVEIGYTKKVHGLGGELKAFINERYLEDFVSAKCLFIELNSSYVPYFPDKIRLGNEILIKFEEVNEVGTARLLQSKKIYLDEKHILKPNERKIEIKSQEYLDMEGFEMQSVNGQRIGEVIEIIDMPSQKMAVVKVGELEKIIPLNEHFVKSLDRAGRLLIMDLPEGLLEL